MASDLIYSEVEQTEVLPPPTDARVDRPASGITVTDQAVHSNPEPAALFPSNDLDNLRARWREVQGNFVDEPRRAVEQANQLVEQTIQRLTDVFSSERTRLENEWRQGKDVSTEDLRQALRRYRSFFDRLLSV